MSAAVHGQPTDVGVDFGTATTFVAARPPTGPPEIVPLGRSTAWLPSLARADGDAIVAGEDADDGNGAAIRSVKGAITHRRSTVTGWGPDGPVTVAADAAVAAVLAEAARRAGAAGLALDNGCPVRLGCPVLWDGGQRRRLLDVAGSAGLAVDESRLIEEPVAAGLAWLTHAYLGRGERPEGRLMVFDMGGGTLDIAVMAVSAGPRPRVAVLGAAGSAVAGDALDTEMARDMAAEMAGHGVDVTLFDRPEVAWALLERAAREAKTRLSHVDEHLVMLPTPLRYPHPVRYDRTRLEAAFRGQMDGAETLALSALRTARSTRQPLTAAQLRAVSRTSLADDVDFVLLVGGMSRIPYVQRRLAALFRRARIYRHAGGAADEAVVAGLAGTGDEEVTLHRPGFDLVLEWGEGRRVCYEAYTPLFEPWQIYSGYSELVFERWLRPPDVPARGEGRVRAFGLSGREVALEVDGRVGPVPVRFGPDGVALRLSGDGAFALRDAGGGTALRADGWPLPAGPTGGRLVLRRVRASP
jgi:molecular chaperone DnaK (HSP70)